MVSHTPHVRIRLMTAMAVLVLLVAALPAPAGASEASAEDFGRATEMILDFAVNGTGEYLATSDVPDLNGDYVLRTPCTRIFSGDTPVSITAMATATANSLRDPSTQPIDACSGCSFSIGFGFQSRPLVTTEAASGVDSTTATLEATINAQNDSTSEYFQYGESIAYGQSCTGIPVTVSGATDTTVTCDLIGLRRAPLLLQARVRSGRAGAMRTMLLRMCISSMGWTPATARHLVANPPRRQTTPTRLSTFPLKTF